MNLIPLEAIYTSNDTYTEVPPAGADGFSSATITVDVPSSPSTLTIDRITTPQGTYYLSDFISVDSTSSIALPGGSFIVEIGPGSFNQVTVWRIRYMGNNGSSNKSFVIISGHHYFMFQGSSAVLNDSNGEVIFYLSDAYYGDDYANEIAVSISKFNFDFTTVPN